MAVGVELVERAGRDPGGHQAQQQHAKIGPDKDIPHITPEIIIKYITNPRQLGLL
jgi:hypothetical protein